MAKKSCTFRLQPFEPYKTLFVKPPGPIFNIFPSLRRKVPFPESSVSWFAVFEEFSVLVELDQMLLFSRQDCPALRGGIHVLPPPLPSFRRTTGPVALVSDRFIWRGPRVLKVVEEVWVEFPSGCFGDLSSPLDVASVPSSASGSFTRVSQAAR